MQHKKCLVHMKSANFIWPAIGLYGGYLYFSTSSKIGLLPICLAEKYLVVQGRSKSLERIEI